MTHIHHHGTFRVTCPSSGTASGEIAVEVGDDDMPVVLMDIMEAFYANNLMISKLCTVGPALAMQVVAMHGGWPRLSLPSVRAQTDAAPLPFFAGRPNRIQVALQFPPFPPFSATVPTSGVRVLLGTCRRHCPPAWLHRLVSVAASIERSEGRRDYVHHPSSRTPRGEKKRKKRWLHDGRAFQHAQNRANHTLCSTSTRAG